MEATPRMKRCSKCNEDLPLSEFGIDRHNTDALSFYCRICVREKNAESRRRVLLRRGRLPRKTAQIGGRPRAYKDRVQWAIKRNHKTRTAIQRLTDIPLDELCDLLAEMAFDDETIRVNRIKRTFEVAA